MLYSSPPWFTRPPWFTPGLIDEAYLARVKDHRKWAATEINRLSTLYIADAPFDVRQWVKSRIKEMKRAVKATNIWIAWAEIKEGSISTKDWPVELEDEFLQIYLLNPEI